MKEKIISIDQGTSSTRSSYMIKKDNILIQFNKNLTNFFPVKDGEHNPDQIWKTVIDTLLPLFKEMDYK